jgi:hypothetical protein
MRKWLQSLILGCALALTGAATWATDAADSFIIAIKQDNPSRLVSLFLQGVDPNTRDPRGVPGLYLALQEDSLKAAHAILNAPGLNPNLSTPTDETPLMMAAIKGQVEMARALIAKGAQVNRPGWTPLHYAATGENADMIRLLLNNRAEVDARSPNESTPLMMAARYGSAEVVQMLLRAGADPRARNQLGMDALDFAVSGERPDAVELLTEAKRRAPVRAAAPPAPPTVAPASRSSFSGVSGPLPTPGQAVQVAPPGQAEQITPATPASAPVPKPASALQPPLPAHGQAVQVTPDAPGQAVQTTPATAASAASAASAPPRALRLTLPMPGQTTPVPPAASRPPVQAPPPGVPKKPADPVSPTPAPPPPPARGGW